jgi:hypothetical protein
MRLGDHDRTVIMAVPPTAHAMSGIHQQHDPVDVAAIDQAAFAAYGWTDLDPVQRVSAGSIHQLTWPQPCEPKVSL